MRQLLVVAVLLGAILIPAYWYYSRHVAPVDPVIGVRVETVEGDVRRGNDGSELGQAVVAGESLPGGSFIRTGSESRVSLSIPEGGKVDLAENSELAVRQIFDDAVRFELRNGQIEATVKQFHKRKVEVGVKDNLASVRITDGQVKMSADGEGGFAVGASTGQGITLMRPGQGEEPIPAGEQRAVRRDGVIAESGSFPHSVLLKVQWPEETVQRESTIEVHGSVSPGTSVDVGGKRVPTDVAGNFSTSVPLKEGKNTVTVEAVGLGGRARTESPELTVDTRPPKVETSTDKLWK